MVLDNHRAPGLSLADHRAARSGRLFTFAARPQTPGGSTRQRRTRRLVRWTRQLERLSKFVRALTTLVEDLTVLVKRSRVLMTAVIFLALTVGALGRLI